MEVYNDLFGNNCVISVDLRTIGRCDSPLIVDRSPPVAGIVNDGEIHGVDLDFTRYEDKVLGEKCVILNCDYWRKERQ